ncbi:2-succinyl-5-enolpyruvyl-6-hydroxy-3-cyclohexene-1-carboxylic-acid synthase [Vibrio sp. RC27]
MSDNQAQLNRVWSQVLLEELSRIGVSQVCVAPGSRSTPLTLEADANPKLTVHSHFDERGLGFLALGLAKASHKPVAVIVTSGTAVANLLPAVAEANLTKERLILLTADRPPELVGCGANQAIVQPGIFSSHVTAALNLPSPNTSFSLPYLLTSIDELLHKQALEGGAIHINCPFPEPLYCKSDIEYSDYYNSELLAWSKSDKAFTKPDKLVVENRCNEIDFQWLNQRKGVFVLGQLELAEAQKAFKLAQNLGWPVLCDPQSGVTSDWAHYDLWLQHPPFAKQLSACDCIVQFGSRIVSKRLHAWLKQQVLEQAAHYFYVSPLSQRDNPQHLPQTHIIANANQLCEQWYQGDPPSSALHHGWVKALDEPLYLAKQNLEKLDLDESVSEIMLAKAIHLLPTEADLFIGNSMIVRLIDMFAQLNNRETFSNRGASGIDGLVASAVGVQKARSCPLILLIGDTSLLYDLNSLALVAQQTQPFIIIVTNNDGGAIFDMLPVPEQKKLELYQMPHGFEFQHAAAQFGLSYFVPNSTRDLIDSVTQHIDQGRGGLVVEVKTANHSISTLIQQQVNKIYALK